MYEILFKWGLDTLREVAGDVSKEELAFALEAVKTKNAFVVRRFDEARGLVKSWLTFQYALIVK